MLPIAGLLWLLFQFIVKVHDLSRDKKVPD